MDKNNILRSYTIEEHDGVKTLYQTTSIEGTYGNILICCYCELEGTNPCCTSRIWESSGQSAEELFIVRNAELLHFVLNILPLFNPLTFNKDALSFKEKE